MIIYTVITNKYDILLEPWTVTPGWRYVCFSDTPIKSDVWEFVKIENTPGIDRRIKIRAHDYFPGEKTIYVDGFYKIRGDLNAFLDSIPTTFSIPGHRQRNCVYQEAAVLRKRRQVNVVTLDKQINSYRKAGFPENWGLGANGILIRDLSDPKVIAINEHWWKEWKRGAKRDQLSLMYCFWKAGWSPDLLSPVLCASYFKSQTHNYKKKMAPKKRYWWLVDQVHANDFKIGAEVGCANGTTTSKLLQYCPNLKLYAVDKWEKVRGGPNAGDVMRNEGETGRTGSNCTAWDPVRGFARFNDSTRPFIKRLTVLRGDSSEMASEVSDGSLDFVFIDADHRYPAVIKDLAAWAPKLKAGGMLCGHDIHLVGVRQAIDEKLKQYTDTGVDHVWFCKKEDYVD